MIQRYSFSMRWCFVMHEDDFVTESAVLLFVPWKKVVCQKLHILNQVIFTPSGTLKGSTSSLSLPLIPAQNMTPPPPCWHRSLVGTWWPFTNHPPLHPSGPSRVARHSSVNKTVLWINATGGSDTLMFVGLQRHQQLQISVCCFVMTFQQLLS